MVFSHLLKLFFSSKYEVKRSAIDFLCQTDASIKGVFDMVSLQASTWSLNELRPSAAVCSVKIVRLAGCG